MPKKSLPGPLLLNILGTQLSNIPLLTIVFVSDSTEKISLRVRKPHTAECGGTHRQKNPKISYYLGVFMLPVRCTTRIIVPLDRQGTGIIMSNTNESCHENSSIRAA